MQTTPTRILVTGPFAAGKTHLMNSLPYLQGVVTVDTDDFFCEITSQLNNLVDDEFDKLYNATLWAGFQKFEEKNPAKLYVYFGRLEDTNYKLPFQKFDETVVLLPDLHTHAAQYLRRCITNLHSQPRILSYCVRGGPTVVNQPVPHPWDQIDWMSKEEFDEERQKFASGMTMDHETLREYLIAKIK